MYRAIGQRAPPPFSDLQKKRKSDHLVNHEDHAAFIQNMQQKVTNSQKSIDHNVSQILSSGSENHLIIGKKLEYEDHKDQVHYGSPKI